MVTGRGGAMTLLAQTPLGRRRCCLLSSREQLHTYIKSLFACAQSPTITLQVDRLEQ